MSNYERSPKHKERHPAVPPDAIVQNDLVKRLKPLGIGSIYKLNQLVERCVAEGSPAPITPEDNAYKYGRWYPAALVMAIEARVQAQEQDQPNMGETEDLSAFATRNSLAKLLSIGVATANRIADYMDQAAATNEQPGKDRIIASARGHRVPHYRIEIARQVMALLDIDDKADLEDAPPEWVTVEDMEDLLPQLHHTEINPIIASLIADPAYQGKFGDFFERTRNKRAKFYHPIILEAVRRIASQSRDRLRTSSVRERVTPTELPPAASAEELLPHELETVASNDPAIMAALDGIHQTIERYQASIARIPNRVLQGRLGSELTTIRQYANEYRHEVTVLDRDRMRVKLLGLERVLGRLRDNLRSINALDESGEED